MAFDGLVMAAVKCELEQTLLGGRIEKIYQPLSLEIALIINKDRSKYRLLISADPRDARIHLTSSVKENPLTPPLFCMVLRKHLEGGKISRIEQPGLERILHITIQAFDELGNPAEKNLVCEVMGKHSNIVLVDSANNIILDGIKRFSFSTSRHREILPGRHYISPPSTGKLSLPKVTEEEFRSAVWNPDDDQPLDKTLLAKFEGLSPQTCREIVARAGIKSDTTSQFIGELELQKLWEALTEINKKIITGKFDPTICWTNRKPTAFSAVELTLADKSSCERDSMNAVLDKFFTTRAKQEHFSRSAAKLLNIVKDELKKCQKKIAIHKETLVKGKDAEKLRIFGELVTANIFQITKGMGSVFVTNYYDPDQNTVIIPLDPRLSPAGNAQLYFKKYAKARHGSEVALKYLEELGQEVMYLESVAMAIEQAEELNALAEIRSELIREGYIKPEQNIKGKKPASVEEPVPMIIEGEKGFKILIGRNNRQNDYLTMKLAGPEDLWFHVKDIPGSHVVVKNPGKTEVPDNIIEQAAELAAFFSKARNSSKVPVDYTFRKHVRKPKKAKPGMVIYDNQTTVMVEPKNPDQ